MDALHAPSGRAAIRFGVVATVLAVAGCATAPPPLAFVSIRSGDAHIYVADGRGHEAPITQGKSVNTQPAWSADGRLAFVRAEQGMPRVVVSDRDGQAQRRLTADDRIETAPSWSPDGRALALYSTGAAGDSELRIVELAAGRSVAVAGNGRDKGPSRPVWSSDGRRIVFTGLDDKGRTQVWLVERDGSSLRAVSAAASPRGAVAPSLSPDGRRVLYVADVRGPSQLFMTDLHSGETRNLSDGVAAPHESPRWSPDGRLIAFASPRDDVAGTRTDIFVMNADGSGVRNLSRHPQEDFDPQWSADGRHIVFASLRSGTSQLYEVGVDDGATRRLTTNTSHDMDHALRP